MRHNVPETTVKDPVCHMDEDARTAKYRSEYQGRTYSFCSRMCLNEFEGEPQRYVNPYPRRSSYPNSEGK